MYFCTLENACNLRLVTPRRCRIYPTPIRSSLQLLHTCSELKRTEFLSLNLYTRPVNILVYAVDFKLAYIILVVRILLGISPAFELQTPGKFPEEYKLHSEHGESLKTTI